MVFLSWVVNVAQAQQSKYPPPDFRWNLFALAALLLFTGVAAAGAGTGSHCGDASCAGCQGCGQCVLVPETKPVKKVIYEIKCVPYCDHAPPSCLHGRGCTECDLCGKGKDGSGHALAAGSHCCPQCRAHPKYKIPSTT